VVPGVVVRQDIRYAVERGGIGRDRACGDRGEGCDVRQWQLAADVCTFEQPCFERLILPAVKITHSPDYWQGKKVSRPIRARSDRG
jgi:hypothetical protein